MSLLKVIKLIGNILFWIALVTLLLVVLVSFATHMASGGRSMLGSYSFGVVSTGSMEPDLKVGTFILIESVSPNEIKIGDTITFRSSDPSVPEGAPVTHNVVDISFDDNGNRSFTTKGTANPQNDEYPVHDEDVFGRVTFHSGVIGAVVRFSQSQWLFPILIVILVINLVFSMISVAKEAEKYKKDQQTE